MMVFKQVSSKAGVFNLKNDTASKQLLLRK